jgi:hypothetical protein
MEWLALLQHHGGPTRLFDITRSFFVATFFAIDGARGDVALWAFHEVGMILGADRVLKKDFGSLADSAYRTATWKHANSFVSQESNFNLDPQLGRAPENRHQPAAILVLEPEMLFDRIAVQQGLFLFPANLQASLEANLANTFGWEQLAPEELTVDEFVRAASDQQEHEIGVAKIVLKRGALPAIARDLHAMNVNAASIYPGLDGFAKSLSPIFSPTQYDPNRQAV